MLALSHAPQSPPLHPSTLSHRGCPPAHAPSQGTGPALEGLCPPRPASSPLASIGSPLVAMMGLAPHKAPIPMAREQGVLLGVSPTAPNPHSPCPESTASWPQLKARATVVHQVAPCADSQLCDPGRAPR